MLQSSWVPSSHNKLTCSKASKSLIEAPPSSTKESIVTVFFHLNIFLLSLYAYIVDIHQIALKRRYYNVVSRHGLCINVYETLLPAFCVCAAEVVYFRAIFLLLISLQIPFLGPTLKDLSRQTQIKGD